MTFPIPDLQKYYKSNPGHYLGHLIGHEGPGSLLSELKSKGESKPPPRGCLVLLLDLLGASWGVQDHPRRRQWDHVVSLTLCFQGWVNTLVGGQKEGARGFMFFIINVDLTEEGLCE